MAFVIYERNYLQKFYTTHSTQTITKYSMNFKKVLKLYENNF